MFKIFIKPIFFILSRIANSHAKLWFRLQQFFLKLNWRLFDLKMTNWIIRRPEWVQNYKIKDTFKVEPSRPSPGKKDIDIRLQDYFENGLNRVDDHVDNASIWGDYRNTLYRPLFEAFENKKSHQYFENVFRSSSVNGYSYGSTFDAMPHRWAYLPIHIELGIVQLAEYLGVLRSECADQGEKAFWRKLKSPEQVVSEIENILGFSIDHPRIGNPRGIMFGGRFITRETGSQIYTAMRIAEIANNRLSEKLSILEIGGGYGGLSYWLNKILKNNISEYNLIDIPEACMMQGFFLGESYDVTLPNEQTNKSAINIRHHTDLNEITNRPNLIINQDSMPEMGWVEAKRYLDWIVENGSGLFISFNQEAYALNGSTGELQASVSEMTKKLAALERLERQYSWDRRGYVEEVYKVV